LKLLKTDDRAIFTAAARAAEAVSYLRSLQPDADAAAIATDPGLAPSADSPMLAGAVS
jgi:antirestriction protein ArdC